MSRRSDPPPTQHRESRDPDRGENVTAIQMVHDPFLNTDDACGYLGVPKATLLTWRVRRPGYGPRAVKAGGRLKYRLSELDRWLRDHEESFAVDGESEEVGSSSGGASQVRTRNRVSRVRGGALRPAQP